MNQTYEESFVALSGQDLRLIFQIIDGLSFTYFLVNLILRFIVCPNKLKFIKEVHNIIEAIAITLFFVFFFIIIASEEFLFDYYFCQHVFSSFMIASLMKFSNLSWRLKTLSITIRSCTLELLLAIFYLAVSLLLISNIMFYLELIAGDKDKFNSIFSTFWWAIVTMTTVGYGDMVPISIWGKLLASFTGIWGIMLIALPVAVIGSRFSITYSTEEKKEKIRQELKTKKKK